MSFLINIDVPDIEAGERFYTEALGLRVGRRFDSSFLELLGGPAPIYLLGAPSGTPAAATLATTPRNYDRHWCPVHLDFVVPDIGAALERAVKAGATVEVPLAEHVYGKLAVLADPFGHGFCLLEFRGRGYDELT